MTELQNKVFELALKKLEKESWFKGVCMDNFPSDFEIERDGIKHAVDSVWFEAAYWDSDMMSGK